MKAALQLHPTRVTEELLNLRIFPVLHELGLEYDVLPRKHDGRLQLSEDVDFVLVLGGDGTFLAGARLATRHKIPILGVMIGRLGFLCSVLLEDMRSALTEIQHGRMQIEERCTLTGRIISGGEARFEGVAVNDIVVFRSTTDKIRDFTARHNGRLIAEYRADGIILASASGSTAYTLAAGGPLVHPALDLLVMTPVCAHSLFTKPLVLPPVDDVEIAGRPGSYPFDVSFDGALRVTLNEGDQLHVSSHPDSLRVYRPPDYDFYQLLRTKFQHGYIYEDRDA
jgi:NAD+ kinase